VKRRVFLVGEGTTDIGDLAYDGSYRSASEGFLQPLIRAMTDDEIEFEGGTLVRLARERVKGVSDALAKKGAAAASLAEYYRADAIVFVTDVDVTPGKGATNLEADTRMARLRRNINDGITASGVDIPRAIGTPCRTIEAWALGDLAAVQEAANLDTRPRLPKKPEELWGKPANPSSNHPKCVFNRVFGRKVGPADYANTAEAISVTELEIRCPRSFAPFALEVRTALP
jgi:hypothetical protein